MTKIITHSGVAHLDDFLSVCLILYKDNSVDTILREAEVSEEELKEKTTWKVDISESYDPDIKAFDHHQYSVFSWISTIFNVTPPGKFGSENCNFQK